VIGGTGLLPAAIRPWVMVAIAVLIAAVYLFPVYWMYASALKPALELNAAPPTLYPHAPTLAAFRWIFQAENVVRFMQNSVVISVATTVLTLVLATGAAYSLARFRSVWMDVVLIGVMLSQVLPPPLLVTPMFVIFRQIGLINTQLAVILATTTKTLPFAVIMLRTTFAQVPIDLEDAARVDGCSRAVAFLRVTLPLARVGYIGEFVYPVSLMNKAALQPATVGLYSFVGADYSDWGNAMAFACVFVTPVIIIFMLLQRRIVSGLTAGALK
jgi:multiple sugar transport system permease protein